MFDHAYRFGRQAVKGTDAMRVFISHSFEEKSKFDDLCLTFEQGEIPYWDPKQMPAGTSLRHKLRAAIKECSMCVFIATQCSLNSGWCQAEIGAFWGTNKPVVVYLADLSVTKDALPEQFKGDIYANSMRDVLKSVKAHLAEFDRTSPEDQHNGNAPLELDGYTILVGPPMKLGGIDISEVTWNKEKCFLVGPNIHENISLEPSRVGNSFFIRLQNPVLTKIFQSKSQVYLDLKDTEGNHWKTAPISLIENFVYLTLAKEAKLGKTEEIDEP